jgi:hypothetical protein
MAGVLGLSIATDWMTNWRYDEQWAALATGNRDTDKTVKRKRIRRLDEKKRVTV